MYGEFERIAVAVAPTLFVLWFSVLDDSVFVLVKSIWKKCTSSVEIRC